MNVRIVQLLCLQRHCVVAAVFDPAKADDASVMTALAARFSAAVDAGEVNPWCELCGGRVLVLEPAETIFATMEEAAGPFAQCQREQAEARAEARAARDRRN